MIIQRSIPLFAGLCTGGMLYGKLEHGKDQCHESMDGINNNIHIGYCLNDLKAVGVRRRLSFSVNPRSSMCAERNVIN